MAQNSPIYYAIQRCDMNRHKYLMQTTFSIINEEVVNEMMYKAEIKNIYRYVLHELLTAPKIKRVFNSLQLFGALVYDYYNTYYTT